MLEDLEFDDAGSPAIGLVPPGVTWQQVHDHIKIAHHHLLIPRPTAGTTPASTGPAPRWPWSSDLGPTQEEAIEEFRAFLQEHDET